MAKKGKRANITPDGEAIIMAGALEYPRLPRTKLAEKLQTEFERQRYDIPEIEVLERKISWYRNHAEAGPLEKPWSTATIDRYPELNIEFPTPEALSRVLKVWKLRIERGDTFTIREAKWAARLSGLLEDTEKLSYKAGQYARTELMFELIGRPFDSIELDRSLMGLPVEVYDFKSFLWLLAEQRENTERGIKDGIEQVKDLITEKKQKGGVNQNER